MIMKFFQIILLLLFLSYSAIAQNNRQVDKLEKLAGQVSLISTIENIKQIISETEKIYKKEKKQNINNYEELAKLTLDFALFRKNIFKTLVEKRSQSKLAKEEIINFFRLYHKNAKELENLLKDTIKIYKETLKTENARLATASFELAWFNENYTHQISSPIEFISWKDKLKIIYETQDLYLQALLLQEKFLGKNDDLTLITSSYLANSYSQSADFEKAIPYYEKYITGIEEKYGRKSEALLPAMRMTGAIWKMMEFEDLAIANEQQIFEITNTKEDLNELILNLAPRAKSFKYDGINEKISRVVYEGSIKTLSDDLRSRSPNSATGISIRDNSIRKNPNFKVVNSILTKVDFVNIIPAVVTIDSSGEVIDVEVYLDNSEIKEKVEKNIREWEFKPFIYNGKASKMKGLVYYYY